MDGIAAPRTGVPLTAIGDAHTYFRANAIFAYFIMYRKTSAAAILPTLKPPMAQNTMSVLASLEQYKTF